MLNQPKRSLDLFGAPAAVTNDWNKFPATRYQGSKRRLLEPLQAVFGQFAPATALDLYSGTATVSLLLRMMGWHVAANDYLLYNNLTARVMLSTPGSFSVSGLGTELKYLLNEAPLRSRPSVATNFCGIYFTDEENLEIDRFCQNIGSATEQLRDIFTYSVGQALLMKRPYNLFHRSNLAMRTRSVERSFGNVKTWNTPIFDHAYKIALSVLRFPFPAFNQSHSVSLCDTRDLSDLTGDFDLVYLDPPYMNRAGTGVDYSNFYHFLEGLCDYSLFDVFEEKYAHRPIASKPSAWINEDTALDELSRVLSKWKNSKIVLSYRSDGRPGLQEIKDIFRAHDRTIDALESLNFKYALSNEKETKEIILISK